MCFITFNKGYVVFPSEIKFLPINIFWAFTTFFSVKYLSLKELRVLSMSKN